MQKRIVYPHHVLEGIRPALRDYPLPDNIRLFGADTETIHGKPYTVQIFDGRETSLEYVDEDDVLENFWEWVRPRCRSGGVNLCYFHNLHFDFTVLFTKFHAEIYDQFSDVSLNLDLNYRKLETPPAIGIEHIRIKALFGKVNTVKIFQGNFVPGRGNQKIVFHPDVTLEILDSRAFTQTSLAKSLKMFGVEGNKLPLPKGLGDKRLKSKEFEEYAKQDAVVERKLAEKILAFHAEYKVRPAISLSQFSGRVFRRYFVAPIGAFSPGERNRKKEDSTIKHPNMEIARSAEISYHAGKNGFYLSGPRVLEDVYEIDINSCFPFAMSELPQMVSGDYKEVRRFDTKNPGIYEISGSVLGGTYPLVYDDNFKPVSGAYAGIWVTGYELERILESPWITAKIRKGYIWKAKPGANVRNSFKDFVLHFFKKKAKTPKEDPHYHFYKIILNALYGRFAASIEERIVKKVYADDEGVLTDELTGKKVWGDYRADPFTGKLTKIMRTHRAGGMTNFFIASLITGRARAMLYDLEVKYNAIHSATDSVKTLLLPENKPGLGGHKIEAFGRCYLFRNKLYLHFSKTREHCGHKPEETPDLLAEDGQHLCKAAYHGFKGKPAVLFEKRKELMQTHHLKYGYTHVVGLREGLRRNETPCDFVQREDEVLCLCTGEKRDSQCADSGLKCHCIKSAENISKFRREDGAESSARVPVTS